MIQENENITERGDSADCIERHVVFIPFPQEEPTHYEPCFVRLGAVGFAEDWTVGMYYDDAWHLDDGDANIVTHFAYVPSID
jgi:hypothetical protein